MIHNDIIFWLSKHYPVEYQERAIKYLVDNSDKINDEDIGSLLERGCKDTFENTVKVFSILGYPKIATAIPSIFRLFQDLNWPGSMDAMRLLSELPLGSYKTELNRAIKEAIESNDEDWIYGIGLFIEKENLCAEIDKKLRECFYVAYQKYLNY